jgi:hypothetical protein
MTKKEFNALITWIEAYVAESIADQADPYHMGTDYWEKQGASWAAWGDLLNTMEVEDEASTSP